MRIAIAVDGDSVSGHFGHCAEFALVDIEDGKVAGQSRVAPPPHEPGVLPAFLRQQGAECVVAGGMGPRAVGLFEQHGIHVILGVQGPVSSAVDALLQGELVGGASTCNSHGHGSCGSHDGDCHHA